MTITRALRMMFMAAALAACVSTPATPERQDVDFVRGCWVDKDATDGRIDALLRLLPAEPDALEYSGDLDYVRGIRPGPQIGISIARDGTHASVTQNGERTDLPAIADTTSIAKGSRQIVFGSIDSRTTRLEVAGTADTLTMTVFNGVSTLGFNGQRGGCD